MCFCESRRRPYGTLEFCPRRGLALIAILAAESGDECTAEALRLFMRSHADDLCTCLSVRQSSDPHARALLHVHPIVLPPATVLTLPLSVCLRYSPSMLHYERTCNAVVIGSPSCHYRFLLR
jgi:hypothetical protein